MEAKFQKRLPHPNSFYCTDLKTQIDFVFVIQCDQKLQPKFDKSDFFHNSTSLYESRHNIILWYAHWKLLRQNESTTNEAGRPKTNGNDWRKWRHHDSSIKLPPVTTINETWEATTRTIAKVLSSTPISAQLTQVTSELKDNCGFGRTKWRWRSSIGYTSR